MDCHICNHPTESFVHEKTNIIYYHCEACEYIFKSLEHHQDFSTQKERYDLHTNDENDEGYKAYFQRFVDFILPLVNEPKSALDFGCGKSTILSAMLEEKGIACDYFDPIYHPNRDESKKYDLIVSTEVFEHLHQPREVFESLLAKLHDGAYLAIQTEFHKNDMVHFSTWWYPQDPTHIVFFTPKTFEVLCNEFACDVVGDNGKNMIVVRKI